MLLLLVISLLPIYYHKKDKRILILIILLCCIYLKNSTIENYNTNMLLSSNILQNNNLKNSNIINLPDNIKSILLSKTDDIKLKLKYTCQLEQYMKNQFWDRKTSILDPSQC